MGKEKLIAVKVIPVGDDTHFNEKFPIYVSVNGKEVFIKPNTKVYLTKAQISCIQLALIESPSVGGRPSVIQPRFLVQDLFENNEEETKSEAKESTKLPKKA